MGLTRMWMSWSLRQILKRAREYTDAWKAFYRGDSKEEPEYKLELEKMRKAFWGEIPLISHTYDGWGVMQTTRIFNDENHLKTIATHTAYDGHMIAEEVAKRENVFINIGPRLTALAACRLERTLISSFWMATLSIITPSWNSHL